MAKALKKATTPERRSMVLLWTVTPESLGASVLGEVTGASVVGEVIGASVDEVESPGVCPAVQLDSSSGGNRTASITWITPLLASMSASVTFATPLITTSPSITSIHNSCGSNKVETAPGTMSELMTLALTTWYNRVPTTVSLSGISGISANKTLKAASVGAKTVKASLVSKASANPYSLTKVVSSTCSGDSEIMSRTVSKRTPLGGAIYVSNVVIML